MQQTAVLVAPEGVSDVGAPRKYAQDETLRRLHIQRGGDRVEAMIEAAGGMLERDFKRRLSSSDFSQLIKTIRRPPTTKGGTYYAAGVYRHAIVRWADALDNGELLDMEEIEHGLLEYYKAVDIDEPKGRTQKQSMQMQEDEYARLLTVFAALRSAGVDRVLSTRYRNHPNARVIMFLALWREAARAGIQLPCL